MNAPNVEINEWICSNSRPDCKMEFKYSQYCRLFLKNWSIIQI